MKSLYILTGVHHGAEIPLHRSMTVGSSDAADIALMDEVAYDIQIHVNDDEITLRSNSTFQWIGTSGRLEQGRETISKQLCLFSLDGIYCVIKSPDEKLDFCVEDVVEWFEDDVPATALIKTVPEDLADQTAEAENNDQPEKATVTAQDNTPSLNALQKNAQRAKAWWGQQSVARKRSFILIGTGAGLSMVVFAAAATMAVQYLQYDTHFAKIISYLGLNPKDLPGKGKARSSLSTSDALLASQTLQLREELQSKLEKYSIRDYIKFELTPNFQGNKKMMTFNFQGDLTEPEDMLLQGLLQEIKKQHSDLQIAGKITVFKENQPKSIAQIIYGQNPVIVDKSGLRYAVGDSIEGKKILAITRDRVIFKGKRNLVMAW